MLDLNEMVIFTKVVEARTFSGAARLLGLPKSTVSRKVSQLEARLGARLLQRTTRSVQLTELGAAYYERCSSIVADAEDAERTITRCQENPRGVLRVSALVSLGKIIGGWVAEYLVRYPEVHVELDLSNRIVDLVEEGYDVAVRAGVLEDSSLVARRLGRSRRYLCASPDYLARNGAPQTPQELKSHASILYGEHGQRLTLQLTRKSETVRVPVSGRLLVNDMQAVLAATLAGVGIAALPDSICREDLAAGRLVALLDEWKLPEGGVYIVYPSPRHLSPKVRTFIDFIDERFNP